MGLILGSSLTQLLAIDLADLCESLLQLAIVGQVAAHQRHLLRRQGQMMDLPAGIAGGEDPGGMATAGGAGAATARMTDVAMQERAAENGAGISKALKDASNPLLAVRFHCIQ
jgi:hypothetical protein